MSAATWAELANRPHQSQRPCAGPGLHYHTPV